MKICIDMRPSLSCPTGVGVYLQNLVQALSDIDREDEYQLFSASWKDRFQGGSYPENFHVSDHKWPVRVLNYCWSHLSFPAVESLVGGPLDVVHSPTPILIPSRSARSVTTVHDLHFYKNPSDSVREMKNTFPHKIKDHCMKADAIIAISEYTKRQLIELLEIPSSRIYTIKHGIDPFFQECAPEEEKLEIRKKYNLPASYLLFVGTQEPRKNLSVLIEAFRRIRDRNVHLVLAGPAGWSVEQDELTGERILRTGYVSKQDLRAMYQQAVAVVFPSVEEGFGLPLLEGMASRVPVIASRIPVFQEICNDSCAYFDPERPEELRNAIDEIVDNPELRKELIEKGIQRLKNFSWKETARKTLELYRSL